MDLPLIITGLRSDFSVRDWSGARFSDTVGNLPFTEQTNADEIYAMTLDTTRCDF